MAASPSRWIVSAALLTLGASACDPLSPGACRDDAPEFAYTAPAKSGDLRQSDVAVFADGRQTYLTTDGLSQHPSFSPDGGKIVFSSGRGGGVDVEYGDGYEKLALFTADSTGGNEARLTNGPFDSDPDWSPDGSRVAFVRDRRDSFGDGGQEIWAVDVATGEEELLFEVPREDPNVEDQLHSPVWSPDGDRIAFAYGRIDNAYHRGPVEIWLVGGDGSDARRVVADTKGSQFDSPGLAWSPDGDWLAFSGLYAWDLSRRTPRLVDDHGVWPAWSSDGSQIAYWDPSPEETDTDFQLTVIDEEGNNKERVEGVPTLAYTYGGLDWACSPIPPSS